MLLFPAFICVGQRDIHFQMEAKDHASIVTKLKFKENHSDSLGVIREMNKIISALHAQSYLLASFDSVSWKGKEATGFLHVGEPYKWASLQKGNLDEVMLRKIDFKEKIFRGRKFNISEVAKLENRILEYAENHGRPFASVRLDSVKVSKDHINATLHFTPGIPIEFDSVGIIGDAVINRKFLRNYLQIKAHETYDQRKVDNINSLLQKLNIATIKKEPEVRFINGLAYVYLFLDAKKTTGIDGIAGLQQDKIDPDKLLLTGEFNLNLRNVLQSGKRAELHWRKLNRGSSSIEAAYAQPALFGSPLELNSSFYFIDQDSTFITINPKIGMKYQLVKWGAVGFFYELHNTRLQDTSLFRNYTKLPPFADSKISSYGLTYEWNNLDDYYNPRKGILLELEGAAGNKVIDKVLAPELYEGIKLQTLQLQGNGKIEHHLRLNRTLSAVQRVAGAYIINDRLFFNDLYRIGGINSLRGFRDFSFFASKYVIETLELRIFTEETSYFMVFVDYGQYVTEIEDAFERNFPLGFGAGLSFSTRAGIFNMVYAVGKESGGSINFNNSVINFGLVSRF